MEMQKLARKNGDRTGQSVGHRWFESRERGVDGKTGRVADNQSWTEKGGRSLSTRVRWFPYRRLVESHSAMRIGAEEKRAEKQGLRRFQPHAQQCCEAEDTHLTTKQNCCCSTVPQFVSIRSSRRDRRQNGRSEWEQERTMAGGRSSSSSRQRDQAGQK